MKLKYCPNCRKSGKKMITVGILNGGAGYFVECPSCCWCGKTYPWRWLAVLSWNRIKRDKP